MFQNGERLEQDNSKLSKQNAVLEKEVNTIILFMAYPFYYAQPIMFSFVT